MENFSNNSCSNVFLVIAYASKGEIAVTLILVDRCYHTTVSALDVEIFLMLNQIRTVFIDITPKTV